MRLRLSAFPKCYIETIANGQMSVFEWIEMSRQLDADGLEMYSGFLTSFHNDYLDCVREAIEATGRVMPMFCCSPDFTAPDADQRKREVEREIDMIRVTARLGGRGAVCRILSGQRYPGLSWEQGRDWVIDSIRAVLPAAREYGIVLGMENHYKDGFWSYPEFAQKMERFVPIIEAIQDREYFGVQYDPSNTVVAGEDPIALLEAVANRVVSMHASDRYLAEGATLESLAETEGTTGYAASLKHGVTGKGLNDYDAIFSILARHHYGGWVSIEDGMNGMGEMAQSLAFLRDMSRRYFE